MSRTAVPHSRTTIGPEDLAAVAELLQSGMVSEGVLAKRLAERFVQLSGAAGGIPCGSGSQALSLALQAARVCGGARVAMPSYVCPEVSDAVLAIGGTPVFLDIADDLLVDPQATAQASKECHAIIIPHLFGRWRDCTELRGNMAVIIEDFAQCLAPREMGFPGLTGDYGCFSLHGTKVVSAGEGGIVVAATAAEAMRLNALKQVPNARCSNGRYPLSDLSAALGLSQLRRLEEFCRQRLQLAKRYDALLPGHGGLHPPPSGANFYFRYPLILPPGRRAGAFMHFLSTRGVAARRPVDTLSHRVFGKGDSGLERSCEAFERVVSLPIYPSLSQAEQDRVCDAVHAWNASTESNETMNQAEA